MLLSPCFLEQDYALAFPSSYHYSRLPPRTTASRETSKHERSKSAPSNDGSFSWEDISTPMHWFRDEHEKERRQRQALEQDVVLLQMRLREEEATRASLEKALVNASSCLSPGCQVVASKARELIAETALIEREVAHLEQRLLWLYRELLTEPSAANKTIHDQSRRTFRLVRKMIPDVLQSPVSHEYNSKSSFRNRLSSPTRSPASAKASPLHHILSAIHPKSQKKLSDMPVLESDTLTGYELTGSLDFIGTANELSEALVRAMVNIYCKLADMPLRTPSPMFSSSSGSSSPLVGGLLSNPFQLSKQLGDSGAYRFMVEVPWISVDSQQLAYVADSLHEFKGMVKRLSGVDPTCMDYNERLAFWINIYNALVMHAHLAYGIPTSRAKRESLLQKASYKVGNETVNAVTVAQCILGCRSDPQVSGQWFQTLLSPLSRLKPREEKHSYGLFSPEPLVCFALCSGARSDPAVRIYTPSSVKAQLQAAKMEFLQASVGIGANKDTLVMPKVLEGFLSEVGVSSRSLLQWLCHNLPEPHSLSLKSCFKRTKTCQWLPYNYSFRYIFATETWFNGS